MEQPITIEDVTMTTEYIVQKAMDERFGIEPPKIMTKEDL